MKLSQFNQLLESNSEKPFHLILPNELQIPISFHITEVAHVSKRFIDCGGKLRANETCQLQAWVADDTEHRLRSGKMAEVIEISKLKGVLPDGLDLDVEFEYEDSEISQYPVSKYEVTTDAVVFYLESKHTDCLAKDVCVPPRSLTMAETQCCGGSKCC